MRKGWEYKKLGEVCDITMGQSPDGNSINEANGVEFHQGKTCFGERFLGVSPLYSNAPTKLAEAHSVLLCVRAPVGYPNITDRKICIGRGLCALYAKQEIDNTFLFYSLLGKQAYFEKNATGSTFKAISSKTVSNTTLSIPPKSTQLAIVSELDKINELIRLKKEQLKDFDNLAQSLFYEMFGDPVENEKGWEVKKIGDLALVKTGPFGSMLHKEDYICDGIPLVNPVHMKDFKIVPDLDFTISKEKASELENYLLKSNDVVFARRGDIGRCAIVSEAEQGFICGTGSLFVRFSKEIESIFIMYIIRCDSFSKHLISKAKGATMLNINSNTIADLRIPLPPLSLQRLFAQRIEQIEREKSEVQKSIQDLETLLASRMQYWFE